MKKSFFSLMMAALLVLAACASPTGFSPTQPSSSDQVATIVAATMQALPSDTSEPTLDACQIPTLKASDASSDCFNASGGSLACAAIDLLGVEAGLLTLVPEVVDIPNLPTGFVVTFAAQPPTGEEFILYLYLDLDQDPTTGLDMSSGESALPGIDRLIGVILPSGESWTQVVAKGGYDAETIRDEAQVSARVVGERVIVLVARALLEDKSVAAGEQIPLARSSIMTVGYALGGALPDAFTLYVATAHSIDTLDYFNGDQEIHIPLAMTVPEAALYPPCPGGS
jgi:hypothetical protein